jgi:hypothetical protein
VLPFGSVVGPPSSPVLSTPRPGVTEPPAVDVFDPARLDRNVAIYLGGLAWLDPGKEVVYGRVHELAPSWPFQLSDGRTICLCTIDGGQGDLVELDEFDGGTGSVTTRHLGFPAAAGATPADAVVTPDGRYALYASMSQTQAGGTLSLERISLDGGAAQMRDLTGLDLGPFGDLANVELRLAVTPDGTTLRVGLEQVTDDLGLVPGDEVAWLIPIDGGIGNATPDPRVGALAGGPCRLQAWATNDDFVQLCRTSDGTRVFIQSTKRPSTEEDIFPASPQDDIGWLVDGTAGVIYGWSATSHQLYRLDIAHRAFLQREFGGPLDPVQRPAETAPPAPRLHGARWQPLRPAWDVGSMPLVGSPDGSILYGVGIQPSGTPDGSTVLGSTGIWAFDAETLAIVGHWPPLATYVSISTTADGGMLIAEGPGLPADVSTMGSQGTELAFVDPVDGKPVALLRRLELQTGQTPQLLPVWFSSGPGG